MGIRKIILFSIFLLTLTCSKTDNLTNSFDNNASVSSNFSSDITPPVILLLGPNPLTIPVGDPENLISYYLNQFMVTDEDTSVTKESVIISTNISASYPHVDSIVYTATDHNNNKSTISRNVIIYQLIRDTTPPDIFFQDQVVIYKGDVFDPLRNVAAFDMTDGSITSKITYTGVVNTSVAGTYTLVYKVSDNAGNTSVKTRTLIVQEMVIIDRDFPVITLNGASTIYINYGQSYIEPGYTAVDLTEGDLTSKVTVAVSPQPFYASKPQPGTYTINYSVFDKSNNSVTVSRKLIVNTTPYIDDIAPVITLTNMKDTVTTITAGTTWKKPALIVVDDADMLSADSVKVETPPNTSVPGTYNVKLYIMDKSGNTGYLFVKVIVVDVTLSVIRRL